MLLDHRMMKTGIHYHYLINKTFAVTLTSAEMLLIHITFHRFPFAALIADPIPAVIKKSISVHFISE